MTTIYLIFAVIALVCFGIGAFRTHIGGWNPISVGLFFLVLNIVLSIALDHQG